VNLLFRGDELAAVLDFRPPDPFLVAYEAGRIALYPQTVTGRDDWLEGACALLRAYQAEHPGVRPDDLVYSGRVWLLHLLQSLYGVKDHYLRPRLLQADLDEFWFARHGCAHTLLANLDRIETAFRAALIAM